MRTPLVTLTFLSFAMPLSAQVNPFAGLSFEAAFSQVSRQVLATKAAQAKNKGTLVEQDIRNLQSRLSRLDMDSWRWRDTLSDIRRRAQQIDQQQPGQTQPPQNPDPFLRNDLQRFIWDLQRVRDDLRQYLRDCQQLVRDAQKDDNLVQPARSLQQYAQNLESDLRRLESDARFAESDIRRAGFTFEAMDLTRNISDAYQSSSDLVYQARELVQKVQG